MPLPSCPARMRSCPAAVIPLLGGILLCSGGPASADTPEKIAAPPKAADAAAAPIYAVRSRFSGQSGVITFTTERPRPRVAANVSGPATRRSAQVSPGGLILSSGYGLRTHPILGTVREHRGVDLAAPTGSPILAPSAGVVGRAGWAGGYGIAVSLEHGGGIQTRYGHLARLNVVAGQTVRQGDILGYVGSTGLSTGPHLHYEVRVNGQAVNPIPQGGAATRRRSAAPRQPVRP